MDKCPACGTKIKSNMFGGGNELIPKNRNDLINAFEKQSADARCNECGDALYYKWASSITGERDVLKKAIEEDLVNIPVITLQCPLNWDYEVCSMVTGQSTTGTGVIAEIAASWTDFFGAQSNAYNNKLRAGEDNCKKALRWAAFTAGANAVIGTDIDYAEVGGERGMLMVCMSGTAVKVRNEEVFSADSCSSLQRLTESEKRFKYLSQFELI
jgi:uncharacterized protein YbjQ (UPF0145 family)